MCDLEQRLSEKGQIPNIWNIFELYKSFFNRQIPVCLLLLLLFVLIIEIIRYIDTSIISV